MSINRVEQITGLILAGGAGRRMGGQDKGWVTVDGQPCIQHCLHRLAPQVTQILISANRHVAEYQQLGYPVLSDADFDEAQANYEGPLAGLMSACQHWDREWLFMVAVDSPYFPMDLVARLLDTCQRQQAKASYCVVKEVDKVEPYYTFGLLHHSTQAALRAHYAAGHRSLWSLWEKLDAAPCVLTQAAWPNLNERQS